MLSLRKMQKGDIDILFNIATQSFKPDYERYGVYPPLLDLKRKRFMPPYKLGITFLDDDTIIGGAFVLALGKNGQIGAIFLDQQQKSKGFGRQAMIMIEEMYANVRRWKLETPSESIGLHRFYESLGYVKIGEKIDKKSGMSAFNYQKKIE